MAAFSALFLGIHARFFTNSQLIFPRSMEEVDNPHSVLQDCVWRSVIIMSERSVEHFCLNLADQAELCFHVKSYQRLYQARVLTMKDI